MSNKQWSRVGLFSSNTALSKNWLHCSCVFFLRDQRKAAPPASVGTNVFSGLLRFTAYHVWRHLRDPRFRHPIRLLGLPPPPVRPHQYFHLSSNLHPLLLVAVYYIHPRGGLVRRATNAGGGVGTRQQQVSKVSKPYEVMRSSSVVPLQNGCICQRAVYLLTYGGQCGRSARGGTRGGQRCVNVAKKRAVKDGLRPHSTQPLSHNHPLAHSTTAPNSINPRSPPTPVPSALCS